MQLFSEYMRIVVEKKEAQTSGNPFSQIIHDGGTLENKIKFQAVGMQFISPFEDFKNVVVCVAFTEAKTGGSDKAIAKVVQEAIKNVTGFTPEQICVSMISDKAASGVCNQEGFEGITGDTCLMHDGDKIGLSALGILTRSKNKVVVNPCVEAKSVYEQAHKLGVHFSYSGRFNQLKKVGETMGYRSLTRIELDLNNTRVAAKTKLLCSICRNIDTIKVYFQMFQNTFPDLEKMDFSESFIGHMREFEGILEISRVITTLAQYEKIANRAMGPVLKLKLLKDLRAPKIALIDGTKLKSNPKPRPDRVEVSVESLSDLGRTVLERAILEAERRFCLNTTEALSGECVELTDEDLICMAIDPRTCRVIAQLVSASQMDKVQSLVFEKYVDFGMRIWERNDKESRKIVVEVEHDSRNATGSEKEKQVVGGEKGGGKEGVVEDGMVEDGGDMHLNQAMEADFVFSLGDDMECESEEVDEDPVPTLREREQQERRRLMVEFDEVFRRWKKNTGDPNLLDWKKYLSVEKMDEIKSEKRKMSVYEDLIDVDISKCLSDLIKANTTLSNGNMTYGLIPLLACCHLGALNAESFCERVISCANDVVTKLHTRLLPEIIEKIVVLRMNKTFMEWMRTEHAKEIVRCGGKEKTHKSAIPPG